MWLHMVWPFTRTNPGTAWVPPCRSVSNWTPPNPLVHHHLPHLLIACHKLKVSRAIPMSYVFFQLYRCSQYTLLTSNNFEYIPLFVGANKFQEFGDEWLWKIFSVPWRWSFSNCWREPSSQHGMTNIWWISRPMIRRPMIPYLAPKIGGGTWKKPAILDVKNGGFGVFDTSPSGMPPKMAILLGDCLA